MQGSTGSIRGRNEDIGSADPRNPYVRDRRAARDVTAHVDLAIKELDASTWRDFETLFAKHGVPSYCWCMYYQREQSREREMKESGIGEKEMREHNRKRKKALVEQGRSHGILVYEDDVPVGWCAYGPKEEFPRDFVLKIEFRAEVNADSGIFLRKPQLQCRDYLVAGPYKELKKYKPQDWNEIEVTVTDGVAHCICNGEVLEEALKVPATGSIGLEADRGKMEYRRIRLKEAP